ncbi:hypothetical protein GN244_ATG11044 [Phytophthora infestans]|uniref:Secreted RxLR effector peptide protein n=1 Tax=Phytophthora infestans TaxID=4787 RepID=A0A833WIS4_PHYIN|nr:hypothetical protein GN244_ATG11044 [Phytophthora infestans]KAF4128329.1 hypothetical protein GN958_ATG22407 [Phytophthora infestans]
MRAQVMCSCFIVMLSVLALNIVSAVPSTHAAEGGPRAAQTLRAEPNSQDLLESSHEERGIVANIATKLKGMERKNFVRLQSIFIYNDDIGQKLLQKKISPDEVWKYLELNKMDRRWNYMGKQTASYKLWRMYSKAWENAHPRWKSQLTEALKYNKQSRCVVHVS